MNTPTNEAFTRFENSENGRIYREKGQQPEFRAALVAVHLMQLSRLLPQHGEQLAEGLQHLIRNGCPHLLKGPDDKFEGSPIDICEQAMRADLLAEIKTRGNT